MNCISADEIRKDLEHHYVTHIKYVRVKGEYRFAFDGEWNTPKHSDMLNKGESAESASYVAIYKATDAKPARIEVEGWSTTCSCGSLPEDEANIMKLIFS